MTAADLKKVAVQFGVLEGELVHSLVTTHRPAAERLAAALNVGGSAEVVTRQLYAGPWTSLPAEGGAVDG